MGPEQISFIAWLISLFNGLQAQQLLVFLGMGFLGIYSHYFKKEFVGELSGGFYNYLVGDHPRQTLITLTSFLGSAIAYVFSGSMEGAEWSALVGLAFTTGYSLDSALNKGKSQDKGDSE